MKTYLLRDSNAVETKSPARPAGPATASAILGRASSPGIGRVDDQARLPLASRVEREGRDRIAAQLHDREKGGGSGQRSVRPRGHVSNPVNLTKLKPSGQGEL